MLVAVLLPATKGCCRPSCRGGFRDVGYVTSGTVSAGPLCASQLARVQSSRCRNECGGVARWIKALVNHVTEILNGPRAVMGDLALRLGRFFGMSGECWLILQKLYELRWAKSERGAEIRCLPTLAGEQPIAGVALIRSVRTGALSGIRARRRRDR